MRFSVFSSSRCYRFGAVSAAGRALLVALLASGVVGSAVGRAAQRDERVYAAAENFKPDAIALLRRLVDLDTGTGHTAGLDQAAAITVEELTRLGARVEAVPAAPLGGKNIVATFTGTGRSRVLMIAHLDTVWPVGEVARRPFTITGARATGPGVLDDKGGVVAGLGALRVLRATGFTDFATVTFLLNNNEETGSIGTRQLMQNLARKHDVAFNLEAGRPGDKLVIARKGNGVVELTVKGRAAHAGNAPETGRNAAMEIAHQMLQLAELEDKARGTSLNFTIVQSGDRPNVIPDLAVAKADVRAATEDEFARLERELAARAQHKLIPDCEVTVKLNRVFAPFLRNAATDALAARATALYQELERPLGAEFAGGSADSSISAAAGTPTLDGLGLVGAGGHGPDEYVELESIVPRVYLLARLVMDAGAGR
jgi:glutamate carboxypeptidase